MDNATLNTVIASIDDSAQKYNEKTFYIRIPTIIYLSIFLPLGILGNASVIYIYGVCLKKSNVHFYIIFLAFFDITSCLIGIPLELVELIHYHTYPSAVLCKIQRLVNYTCNIGSAMILLSISLERYIKVCRPMHSQMTRTHCRVVALCILVVSIPFATPISISYDRLPVNVEGNITVYQCAFHFSSTVYIYYSCFLPMSIINFITMFVLYTCVLRATHRHFRQLETRRKANKSGHAPSRRKISRTNMSVICLTMVYAISFTPTLIVGVVTKFYSKVHRSPYLEATLILFYRSWAVNCTVNPIIYGFFNKAYRDSFLKLISDILCLKSPKPQTSKEFQTTSAVDSSVASLADIPSALK